MPLDQQGLSSLLGAGLGQGLGQSNDPFKYQQQQAAVTRAQMQAELDMARLGFNHCNDRPSQALSVKKKPETLREELQEETDDWLKNTI